MESGAFKLLESATQRTLHAHAFSRASNQASLVLTDLLSRYLVLLTSTCAKYAHHAGRTTLNAHDALGTLEELGVSVQELNEYCATEGKELNRYALYSIRRVEDLLEFKSHLAEGLRQDKDDAILLEYARCPTPLFEEIDFAEEEGSGSEEDVSMYDSPQLVEEQQDMDVDETSPSLISALPRKRTPSRPSTPPLPLSPISNPSSPKRKRPRLPNWEPPEYIPHFLPPFPSIVEETPGSPVEDPISTQSSAIPLSTPQVLDAAAAEKSAITLSQSLTTAAASDFLVQVPYSQSSLASISDRHLPSAFPPAPPPPSQARQNRLPTLQIEPSLLGAYHHILTHPPPSELPSLNPSRHKVAMALIKQGQANPRYNPADTLFGSVAPSPPRVSTIGPSYPVPIGETLNTDKGKDSKEKDFKLPQSIPRPVSSIERIAPFISQQTSLIPSLALRVLPPAIHSRTSRLSHPPLLNRGAKSLTYGPGIPAPWNSNTNVGSDGVISGGPVSSKDATVANGKDGVPKPLLPDARLFATWDYDTKDFRVPLVPSARSRSRMGSLNMQSAVGGIAISLPVASRSKGIK